MLLLLDVLELSGAAEEAFVEDLVRSEEEEDGASVTIEAQAECEPAQAATATFLRR